MKITTSKLFRLGWWVLFVVAGCQRGCSCTTTKVIETATTNKVVQGVNLEIKAEKIRAKHMRIFARVPRKTYFSYSVSYNLKVAERPWAEGVLALPIDKETELEGMLEVIRFRFSYDNRHFTVFEKEEPLSVYHLLTEGSPFTTNNTGLDLKEAFLKEQLPTPERIIRRFINQDTVLIRYNESIVQALATQKVPSAFDQEMLAAFPQNRLLIKVMSENSRLKKLLKEKGWQRRFDQKILGFYTQKLKDTLSDDIFSASASPRLINKNYFPNSQERNILDLIQLLNDKAPLAKLDQLVLKTFPYDETSNNYYETRKRIQVPIAASIQKRIRKEVIGIAAKLEVEERVKKKALSYAFNTKDYTLRREVLNSVLTAENVEKFTSAINFGVFFYKRKFTKEEKAFVIQRAERLVFQKTLNLRAKRMLYNFLEDELSCERLREITQRNEGRLSLPFRCETGH